MSYCVNRYLLLSKLILCKFLNTYLRFYTNIQNIWGHDPKLDGLRETNLRFYLRLKLDYKYSYIEYLS